MVSLNKNFAAIPEAERAEWLRHRHWDLEMTMVQIADELGVARHSAMNYMDKYSVPRRSSSEDSKRRYRLHPDEGVRVVAKAHARLRALESDPDWLAKRQKAINDAQGGRKSTLELAVEAELRRRRIRFISQKQFAHFFVDFYLPEMKLCIECDGDYWHTLPARVEKDHRKDHWLTSHGQKVIRLTGTEIHADVTKAVDRCLA